MPMGLDLGRNVWFLLNNCGQFGKKFRVGQDGNRISNLKKCSDSNS